MKKKTSLFLSIILFNACQNQYKNDSIQGLKLKDSTKIIQRITFFEIQEHDSLIKNYSQYNIDVNLKENFAYRVCDIYVNNELKQSDTLRVIPLSEKQKNSVATIPKEYLQEDREDYSFGNLKPSDSEFLSVTIDFENSKSVFWVMGYNEANFSADLLPVFKLYKSLQKQCYTGTKKYNKEKNK